MSLLLLLWGYFLSFADGASAARVSASLFEPSVSTYLTTYTSQEEQATENPRNTNSLFFESSRASPEEATLQAPASEAGFTEGRAERAGSSRTLPTLDAIRSLNVLGSPRVSIALLLLVCLLVVGLKRLPSLKPEVPGVLVGEGIAAAKERLEKIEKLLPAAERLAAAVGGDRSSNLLAVVHGALKEADVRETEAKGSHKKVNDALQALSMLQNAAIGRALEMMRADKDLPVLSPLIIQGDYKGVRLGRDTQQLIMLTYHSLCECSAKLTHMFNGASRRVLLERQFRDEEDGDVLLNTAISLEALRATSNFRRHLTAVADGLREDALSSVKVSLLGTSEMGIRQIEGHAALLRVHAALLKKAEETGKEPLEKSTKTDPSFIEGRLEKVTALLGQLRSVAEAVQVSTTVEAAFEAAAESAGLEDKANDLLDECFAFTSLSSASSESLEGSVKTLVESETGKKMATAEAESLFLLKTAQEASDTVEDAGGKAFKKAAFQLNDRISKHLLDSAKIISVRKQQTFDDMKASEQKLKGARNVAEAMNGVQSINVGMFVQSVDKFQAQLLKLRCRLFAFLQEDMNFVVSEAERLASQSSHLSNLGRQKCRQLKKKLRDALKAAGEAPTLSEAAMAAASVRTYLIALQDLSFQEGDSRFQS